jgi:sugar O-acyltransferase (sialic acid O-acetyltransferase NeuD family)
MSDGIFLWGAKSQARIVAAALTRTGTPPDVLFDSLLDAPDFVTPARFCNTVEALAENLSRCRAFVVCIGGASGAQRVALSRRLQGDWGLSPLSVLSPLADKDPEAHLGVGVQIMARAYIGLGTQVGDFSLINTNATIDHECVLGAGVHVMGAAAIAGRVTIGDHATIGTNATILPNLSIGRGAQIGAGALVRHNVAENEVVVGNPARLLRKDPPVTDVSLLDQALLRRK